MRFQTNPVFDSDWKRLKPEHRRQFRDTIPAFTTACDAYAEASVNGRGYRWPAGLRVKPMRSAAGIWEMTWSFASPDGRATCEFVSDGDGLLLRWRRVGGHGVFERP